MNTNHLLIGLFAAINFVSCFIMANDKRRSMQNGNLDRTPEGFLFFLGAAGGALGIYAGMLLFRHKTKKWYFQIGIPLLILQNLATVYVLTQFFDLN